MERYRSEMVGVVAEVADVAGPEAAMRLAHRYGGARVYVPKDLPDDHLFIDLVGADAARELCWRYGGGYIFPQTVSAMERRLRNAAIREAHREGTSTWTLARRYEVSRRQVMRIVGGRL